MDLKEKLYRARNCFLQFAESQVNLKKPNERRRQGPLWPTINSPLKWVHYSWDEREEWCLGGSLGVFWNIRCLLILIFVFSNTGFNTTKTVVQFCFSMSGEMLSELMFFLLFALFLCMRLACQCSLEQWNVMLQVTMCSKYQLCSWNG